MSHSSHRPSRPSSAEERQLMRLAHGELRGPDARRLRERVDADPELAAHYARIEARWQDLEHALPAPEQVPDVAGAVRARLRQDRPRGFELTPWSAVLSAAALLAGVGLGWWAQETWQQSRPTPGVVIAETPPAQPEPGSEDPEAAVSPETEETGEPELRVADAATTDGGDAARVELAEPIPSHEPVAASTPVARVAAALDEDLDSWSRTLGDEPEWNDELFSEGSERSVLAAAGLESWSSDSAGDSTWDATLAEGWGIPSAGSLALAYLGDEGGGDEDWAEGD